MRSKKDSSTGLENIQKETDEKTIGEDKEELIFVIFWKILIRIHFY